MKTKPKNKQLELDELPDIHREILEIARNDKTRPTFAPEVERTWIAQERDRAWIAQEVERLWIAKLVLRAAFPQRTRSSCSKACLHSTP